jgi:hypothetical protein
MTLVASWINQESGASPSIWTIADTKISQTDTYTGRTFTLTNEGAKLFELPIICKEHDSPPQNEYCRTSIGYAYSGSSLVGLNAYATLSTILSNLISPNKALPDYNSIIEKAKIIAMKYSQSILSPVEICLYGFCPRLKEPFIATIKPIINDSKIHYISECQFGFINDLDCMLLGDSLGQEKFNKMVYERTFLYPMSRPIHYWRAPVYALREIISKCVFDTIGGDLQLTITSLGYFHHHWIVNENAIIPNSFSFRGLDLLTDIGIELGDCLIGIQGMYFEEH